MLYGNVTNALVREGLDNEFGARATTNRSVGAHDRGTASKQPRQVGLVKPRQGHRRNQAPMGSIPGGVSTSRVR